MLQQITDVLNENLGRVDNLISLYGPATVGRRKVQETDILRGALVLLHAGLEDYLRSLMIWKIDNYSESDLNAYGFPNGTKRPPTKFSLGELAAHRGKSVDDLIVLAVKSHLEKYQSFNDLGEVRRALKQCGIITAKVDSQNYGKLPDMISRRHNIVHKADARVITGQSH